MIHDVVIIGGGIIGLGTALQLLKNRPGLSLVILEREDGVARHQTGNNSGVIHSGIYYRPGSLKAENCVRGVKMLHEYCAEKSIPYSSCGKVIVALSEEEVPRLDELERRGKANGVPDLRRISGDELREIEPHCQGISALHAPGTGIIDYTQVAESYRKDIEALGGQVVCGQKVLQVFDGRVVTEDREWSGRLVINCAGVYADRLAKQVDPELTTDQIFPFRGEYYFVRPEAHHLVKGLIYPVPDPSFPFLGVHLTTTIDGRVEAGPNAVLAFSRDGYRKMDVSPRDAFESLRYPGLWRLAAKYWRTGMYEVARSFSKKAFLRALQRYVPELTSDDLLPGGAGVRAQLVTRKGMIVDDFAIVESPRMIHVLSAPSPGATASLSIGLHLSELAMSRLS